MHTSIGGTPRRRLVAAAVVVVAVVAAVVGVWAMSSGEDEVAARCGDAPRAVRQPTQQELRDAQADRVVVCRWRTPEEGLHPPPVAEAVVVLDQDRREEVLRQVASATSREPRLTMIDDNPAVFYTVDVRAAGEHWRFAVPRDRDLGFYLAGRPGGMPYASGDLPRLLASYF